MPAESGDRAPTWPELAALVVDNAGFFIGVGLLYAALWLVEKPLRRALPFVLAELALLTLLVHYTRGLPV